MPKNNKKPAGGRPAKNFEPRSNSGSRSPGHRGYRPDEAGAPAKKARWSADERAAKGRTPDRRDSQRDDRGPSEHGRRDHVAGGVYSRDAHDHSGRGGRQHVGGARKPAGRGYDRDDRPRYDRDDRGGRPAYNRDDRAPRRDGDERPRYNRDDRPSYNRDDRGGRPAYNRDDRPRRDGDSRGRFDSASGSAQRSGSHDRPRYDRDDRPRYDDRNSGSRAERSAVEGRPSRDYDRPRYNREDRGDRRAPLDSARGPRYDDRGGRPAYNRDDRPRRDDRGPRRDFGDRPRYDRDDRAPRRDFGDRPQRDNSSKFYPDKAERSFSPQDDVVLERLQAEAIEATEIEGVTFGDLGLGNNIVRALAELGADAPFPIQAATIPVVLSGKDVLGRGRTGSGKTIAFGAPTVERLMENKGGTRREMGRKPRALILAPTRELALQIDRTVQPIARAVGLFTTQIYGGVPQGRQVGALQRGVDIIIGTPGRIEDLVDQRKLDLSQVQIAVLDEADHMCDLGFLEPVQRILRLTAPDSQKLLFSATLDTGVASLVDEFLVEPAVHEVAGEDQASGTIDHRVLVVDHRDKRDIILQLADREGKTLIFSRTRAFAEDLTDFLEDNGVRAVALHGDLNQNRRTRNLAQLTSGRVDVLVATDVAARGIHVDDIDLVIQADAPDEYKTYLHRSGRTGRAGASGTVVTLIPRQRQRRMAELLGRAEIDVDFADARLGDAILTDIAQGSRGTDSVDS